VAQLRARLPAAAGWRATLRAMDGAVTDEVGLPLDRLPPDASHLVLCVGGDDALGHAQVLGECARTVAGALVRIAGIGMRFRRRYRAMLGTVLARRLPTAVCTICDARLPDPRQRALAAAIADLLARHDFARRCSEVFGGKAAMGEDDAQPISRTGLTAMPLTRSSAARFTSSSG
jgi:hypothetical protein